MPNSQDGNIYPGMMPDLDTFMRERDRKITHEFHDYIKESYLRKICDEVTRSLSFKDLLEKGVYHDTFDPSAPTRQDFRHDIAINASMIHYFNCFGLPKDSPKRTKMYESKDYTDKLINDTIKQCQFRLLLTTAERVDVNVHIPIVHALHVVTNYLLVAVGDYLGIHPSAASGVVGSFMFSSVQRLLLTCKSILLAFELEDVENAYSLLRGMIESFIISICLQEHNDAISEYYKFLGFRREYETDPNGNYPDEFLNIKPKGCSKQNFLNYGWIHSIFPDKDFKYVFEDLVNSCGAIDDESKQFWITMYKGLCKYVHGGIYLFPHKDMDLCTICDILATIIIDMSKYTLKLINSDGMYQGINLIDYLKETNKELSATVDRLAGLYMPGDNK